jgi:N-methylhydantoinase A
VLAPLAARPGGGKPVPAGGRPVYFDGGFVDAAIHQRAELRSGDVVTGPSIVEEYGSTVPVHPGFTATVDGFGNLVVSARSERSEPRSRERRLAR